MRMSKMPTLSPTILLALELIAQKSITPNDASCQQIIANLLKKAGFTLEFMPFGEVQNLYATFGSGSPVLCFAGHTDVVPPGELDKWQYPPFAPQIVGDLLYGRGAADMKGSLAAMLQAGINFVKDCEQDKSKTKHKNSGTLAFLLTSDEEGVAVNGTKAVIEALQKRGDNINYCVVGEPSSTSKLGDVIKNGRRGSLSGTLTIFGKQGHVAYPHLAQNPIHLALPALDAIAAINWDAGDEFFPPTSLQIIDVFTGNNTSNVIPAALKVQFNLRFNPQQTPKTMQSKIAAICAQFKLNYKIDWHLSGMPFITKAGALLDAVSASVFEITNVLPKLSTSGGTSDGRFIATMENCEVIELGPLNATIHQVNECVSVQDLDALTLIYQKIMTKILG